MGRNKKKNESKKIEVKEEGFPTRSGRISMPAKPENYQNCVMFCVKTKKSCDKKKKSSKNSKHYVEVIKAQKKKKKLIIYETIIQ